MRYVLLAFVLLISLNMIACGNKRGPTGGDQDLDKPTVLSSSPAEMGDISGGIIEIDFDKPMDKSSLPNAIYFYPPITEKRINLSRQTLTIEIKEKLQDDTLYYITLSTRIKDTRGNNLDKAHTLI
ncbi:MAG TPA: Ig-like domain-containing protein, partial [Candidatus Cloacimonadota bacterium]|nr:Ig-like domain-containing protein [Candidatus Cloacimonadota bacterium]